MSGTVAELEHAYWRLHRAARGLHAPGDPVSAASYRLLLVIERCPGVRGSDLAKSRGLSQSTVSRQLDRLISHGWVSAAPDSDHRARRLALTPAGSRAVDDVRRRLTERLGPDGTARLDQAVHYLNLAADLLADATEPTTAEPTLTGSRSNS
jgi:DNA-binding MarR family transcriptional regulator